MTNGLLLVIDDDVSMRILLRALIEAQGFRAHTAVDAVSALTWLQSCKEMPTGILTDFRMPEIDGLTLAKVLKTCPRFKEIPLLLITGFDDCYVREEAADLGCALYFTKPIDCQAFCQSLRRLIGPPS
jgi:CheY-like chemotaxis protein